ncbi:MAG: hypothetical protein U5J97_00145 [Trueperaceae bacterium]|nr:hypothetical protein [Trueperaceae bacterium]
MNARIRSVPYYYARVEGDPDAAYGWLAELTSAEVDLLAFSAVPYGPNHVELTIFPVDPKALTRSSLAHDSELQGPFHALLVQGDDHLGALAELHHDLRDAGVSVYASTGVTDGKGGYGYVVYVREQHMEAASKVVNAEPIEP